MMHSAGARSKSADAQHFRGRFHDDARPFLSARDTKHECHAAWCGICGQHVDWLEDWNATNRLVLRLSSRTKPLLSTRTTVDAVAPR